MNLANGEILIAGAFSTFWFYSATKASPLLALLLVAPAAFVLNWAIYRILIYPLVRRAVSLLLFLSPDDDGLAEPSPGAAG
jgi:branched-chain amino acid transport system permease protein